jgi:hypothetical protein
MKSLPSVIYALAILALVSFMGSPGSVGGQAEAETPATVRLCPANPRYLEYKGEPVVLITSAEHYGAVMNLDFDYRLYLETLGSEGFNYTRIFTGSYVEPVENIFGIKRNTLAPLPGRYLAPWAREGGKYDLGRFNPDYFTRLKDFVKEAGKHNIVVEVTLFSSIYAESAWNLSPFNSANNLNGVGDIGFQQVNTLHNGGLKKYQEQFIRKVVSELNGYDNLFFEIQNEPWSDNPCLSGYVNQEDDLFSRPWQKKVEVANGMAVEWQEWVVSVIRGEESKLPGSHLIARNICNFQVDLEEIPDGVSIVNFHYAMPGAVRMNLRIWGVIGLDETGFMPHMDHLYIDQAWRFILSGGGLYNNLDYSFTAGHEAGDWPIPETNPGWGGPQFRKKLSILVETMAQVPFHQMEFSDTILEPSVPGVKQYGLQLPGETYLLFLEHLEGALLTPRVPAAVYEVTWINVESGERKSEKRSLGGGASIGSPFAVNKAALMIRKPA